MQLFNLADDVGEKRDLAAERPELVTSLHAAWLKWSQPLPPRANPKPAKAAPAGAKKRPSGTKPAASSQ